MATKFSFYFSVAFTTLLSLTSALPYSVSRATLPPVFLLAGDSTTHSGSGWGDGFLNNTLKSPAFGINHGVRGASLVSYRAGGYWTQILNQIAQYKAKHEVFVTIQFGHNDQKNPAYEKAFSANLKQFVADVNAAGGVPIVVTPLTRRTFLHPSGLVDQSLSVETGKALAVAKETGSRFIDLNKASTTYVQAIGEADAHKYNLTPSDNTHLNLHGSKVFGRLVSDLLVAKYADINAYTVPDKILSAEIAAGKYA